jgi:hypothetical protein
MLQEVTPLEAAPHSKRRASIGPSRDAFCPGYRPPDEREGRGEHDGLGTAVFSARR